jgi:cytochrome b561
LTDRSDTYDGGAKTFHWLTVALLTVQVALGWLMPDIHRGMPPGRPMNLHLSLGLAIAALVVRLGWRLVHGAPAPAPGLAPWQKLGSSAVHWLLYLLIFAMIVTGWCFASERGWPITLFGLVKVPPLGTEGSPFGHTIGELHGTIVWALVTGAGLHVAAALAHRLLYRDQVLQRMLPGRRRAGSLGRRPASG